jgi:hypothetical protein
MLVFDPREPFPLLASGSYSLSEAQTHADHVDRWLGLRTHEVEHDLMRRGCRMRARSTHPLRQELWIGLATTSLLTPYIEIRRLLAHLNPCPRQTVVDLGAAYGRMGFVIGWHYPQVRFIGYEYVGERVIEARRCLTRFASPLLQLEHVDLSSPDLTLVEADIYFIYDFGNLKAIEKTLHDLRRLAKRRSLQLVVRGRHCRNLIAERHKWLHIDRHLNSECQSTIYHASSASAILTSSP